ncbi:MerR family transcriptional regulator [Mycolicibacterium setense]|uniref:MerR family transcriptional regulator n=1 Tax=Mycolicibacterium setense TaxID=431269 RepID=UPI0009E56130|nr:MerR family transcriptional regulator [Mycolicibacterium setense]
MGEAIGHGGRRKGVTKEEGVARSARGVYGISVAAELSGIGQQTLRLYERWGLITPSRTAGGTRRYSDDDIKQLRRITELVDQGVNLAGIVQILDLQDENLRLESVNSRLELRNAALEADQPTPSLQSPRQTAGARSGQRHGSGHNPDSARRLGRQSHPAGEDA